jgi:hypothetical protein
MRSPTSVRITQVGGIGKIRFSGRVGECHALEGMLDRFQEQELWKRPPQWNAHFHFPYPRSHPRGSNRGMDWPPFVGPDRAL